MSHSDKMKSLARLMIARQAQLQDEDYQVYLEELRDIPAEVVERACRKLARTERAEYETAFPSVGKILSECRVLMRPDPVMETRKMLDRSHGHALDLPKEEAKEFMANLRKQLDAAIASNRSRTK